MPRQDHSTISLPVTTRARATPSAERFGDWILLEPLAAGGFGEVFAAEHAERREPAAVKLLRPELTNNTAAVLRFGREAALLQALAMPGVVRVHEFGSSASGRCFLAMERLSGRDLKQRLRSEGRLSAGVVLAIISQAASVLDAAHARGVVHRDVKASNVFLCDADANGPRVVLLDFGLAKLIDGSGPELTASREIIGTPASMAPEQVLGRRVDARTDVYALGALAFHALTGRAPFEHQSVLGLCQLHLHAAVPSASALAPMSAAVDTVIARSMSKDPQHRFQSCGQFSAALAAALEPGPPLERACNVLAVRVRVTAPPSVLAAGDEPVWSDFENVLPLARSSLEVAGFRIALRVGNALTAVRELPDEPALERPVRAALVESALRLVAELQDRKSRHAAVNAEVCLTTGSTDDCHLQFAAIESALERTAAPSSLLVHSAALDGLGLAGTNSSRGAGWVELSSPRP